VIDLRDVNEQLEDKPFRYEALPEFVASLQLGDHLISWDKKDAFHQVYKHPDDRTYLNFAIDGEVYETITMPIGLSIAPWAWTKVMRPVLTHLPGLGFTLIGYVDDHGAAAPGARPTSKADAAAGFATVARLSATLGLQLQPEKGDREGTQQLTLLGFTIDTARNRLTLPAERVAQESGAAMVLLSLAGKNRRFVRLKALQRMAGLAESTKLAISSAQLYTRAIYDDLKFGDQIRDRRSKRSSDNRINRPNDRPDRRSRHDRRLSHQSVRDLRFWAGLRSGQEFGRLLWRPPASATLHTDASGAAWGGGLTIDGSWYDAHGRFGPADAPKHIDAKAVLAVTLPLLSIEDKLPAGTVVRLFIDSQVALAVITGVSSRCPGLVRELRRIHAVARRLSVALEGEWIPTAVNAWADALSRDEDRTDWSLERRFFLSLYGLYGPHTVDRFASATSAQLPRYNSRYRDPTTEAVDGMSQSWVDDNSWANPSFSLIPLVRRLIVLQRATATVLVSV